MATVLQARPMTVFRVLSEDQVVYVLYDVGADEIQGYYTSERLDCHAPNMWAWRERQIAEAVRCESRRTVAAQFEGLLPARQPTGAAAEPDGGRIVSMRPGTCPS